MVSRRGVLIGAGLLGVGGAGGWLYSNGKLPDEVQALLPSKSLAVGEGTTFGNLEIVVSDISTATTAQYRVGRQSESWTAPPGAKLVLFKLEITNTDITKHEAPAFNLHNYKVMKEEPNTIYINGVNDIRVYGDDEGGVLPEFKYQNLGVESITVHDRRLSAYPGIANYGPSVGPSKTVKGWVWGLIRTEAVPGLRIQTERNEARWRHDDVSPSIAPKQGDSIIVG